MDLRKEVETEDLQEIKIEIDKEEEIEIEILQEEEEEDRKEEEEEDEDKYFRQTFVKTSHEEPIKNQPKVFQTSLNRVSKEFQKSLERTSNLPQT